MNSVIKALVAVFSLVLLFACGGGGNDVSAAFTQPTSTEGRAKALAAGVAPDSGALGTAVNNRFGQCMDTAWNSWFKPSKYAQCVGEGYRVLFEESGIGNQLTDKPHRWLPIKGRTTIGGNFILVQFKLDDEAVNFFKTKFVGSNARLPIGLEIDISPDSNDVFRKAGSVVGLKLPDGAQIFLDTSAFDTHPGYGAVIRNPHKLQAGTAYAVIFYAEGAPWYDPSQISVVKEDGVVALTFQVSIDKPKANAMITAYDTGDHQLNDFLSDGGGGGFSYFVTESDKFSDMMLSGENRICWYDKGSDDKSCAGGNPFSQPLAETVIAANGAVPQSSVSSGDAVLQSGTVAIPGQGPGGYPMLTDVPVVVPPDFVTKRSWLETPWGVETYKYGRTETVQMKGQFKNEGDGPCLSTDPTQTIIVHAYLSKGYKEDVHSGAGAWTRVGTDEIQCANMQPGDTHTETEGIELWRDVPGPGIYNIVWCIDHPQDDHNNGGDHAEKHESNNCSTEAVFEVVEGTVNVPDVDFTVSGLTVLQAPVYAGDYIRLGAWITNSGTVNATTDIRSSYTVSCNGGPTSVLTDDGTMASTMTAGASAWEEILTPVLMPNVAGTCTLTFTADYLGSQSETDEANNSTSITLTLAPRPAPVLSITRFEDKVGCCTTNTGAAPKPRIWVYNGGTAAPGANVTVVYQVSSPVATGGLYQVIGYGTIEPRELVPGDTDEDQMDCDGCWRIPASSPWKKQWHNFRACLRVDGGTPVPSTGAPSPGEVCAVYQRYSKS